MTGENEVTHPEGEYAIVEIMGHSTMVGRIAEIERFGTKMLAIEPIWQNELLPEVLVGGQSIYRLTGCKAEVAFARQAKSTYQMPASVVATLPPAALPAPERTFDETDVIADIEEHIAQADSEPQHPKYCHCPDCYDERPF